MKLREKLRRLFCRHEWEKIAIFEELDEVHNIMYPLRRYRCRKCGRVSHQDGRWDRLQDKAVN